MTESNSKREDLKFVAGTISAAAGVLAIVAYMVQRVQFGLLGLPPDSEVSTLSYANVGFAITLDASVYFFVVVIPILAASRVVSRTFQRKFSAYWGTSWLLIVVFLFSAVAVTLPSFGFSKLYGALWLKSMADTNTGQEALTLFIGNHFFEKIIIKGFVLSSVGLGGFLLNRLLLEWWHGRGSWNLFLKTAIAAIAMAVTLSSFLSLLAATMFKDAQYPEVNTLLRGSSGVADSRVNGILVRETGNYYFIVRTGPTEPPASLIPKNSVVLIDYTGAVQSLKPLLCQRVNGCEMNRELTIAHTPFSLWVLTCAILLILGFTLALPLRPAQASSGPNTPTPPEAPTAPALILVENADSAVTTVTAVGGFLASVQSYFPTVIDSAANLAQAIDLYVGLFVRGGGDEDPADLWLYQPGAEPRRLTTDGGYSSPRPSRDGKRIVFLRQGRPGILDLTTQSGQPLPGSASYERLYGWDESAGTLLAETAEGVVVVFHTDDGRVEPWGTGPIDRQQRADLDVLARMTPDLGFLMVRESNGQWRILEKRWGIEGHRSYVTSRLPITDPAWCTGGIVYVQPGK